MAAQTINSDVATQKKLAIGVDRLELHLTSVELGIAPAVFKSHCQDLKIEVGAMPFGKMYKAKLTILQPKPTIWSLLEAAVGRQIGVLLTYVELVIDFIKSNIRSAKKFKRRFLGAAHVLHQHGSVTQVVGREGATYYFATRSRPGGGKRGNVPVIYADKLSKLQSAHKGSPCVHLEWRIQGSAELRKVGLVTIADLQQFDHVGFWQERIRMRILPSKTQIGAILAGRKAKTLGDEALRKRSRVMLKKFTLGDAFILQNAIRMHPAIARKTSYTNIFEWAGIDPKAISERRRELTDKDAYFLPIK